MGIFGFGKKPLSEVLTKDELNAVVMAISSYSFKDMFSLQLVSDISTGKKNTLTSNEKKFILRAINDAIDKLKPVKFYDKNEEYIKLLSAAKHKL